MKLLSYDRATIDYNNIRDLGNRIIVTGTLAIADQWMRYLNEDGSDRWEYLPQKTLFSPESLSTLQGAPLCVQHPGEVTSDNYRELVSKGKLVGSVSTQLNIDRDRKHLDIVATIYDKPTIDQVLKKGISELSPQYWKNLDLHPDYKQGCFVQTTRDYTGCEVSLVPKARGGKDARLHMAIDSADAPPKQYFLINPKQTNIDKPMATINIDGIDLEVEARDKKLIEKAISDRDSQIDSLTKAKDSVESKTATLEAEKAKLEATNAQLEKDNAAIRKQAADEAEKRDRADVIKTALPIFQSADAKFDASVLNNSSNRRIKEEAIAISLDSLPAVKENRLDKCSDAEINSYWEVISSKSVDPGTREANNRNNDSSDPLRRALSGVQRIDVSQDAAERQKLETDAMTEIENAWKVEVA